MLKASLLNSTNLDLLLLQKDMVDLVAIVKQVLLIPQKRMVERNTRNLFDRTKWNH